MKEKTMKKKRNWILISSILGIFVLLIGVSYAWLQLTLYGTKTQTLKIGSLKLIITNEVNAITLNPAYPLADQDGQNLTPFTFNLENTGDAPVKYTLRLVDDAAARTNCGSDCSKVLPIDAIKYKFEKSGATLQENAILPNSRVLDEGIIAPGSANKIAYKLRLWMDNRDLDVTYQDASFFGKIEISASQINPDDYLKKALVANLGATGSTEKVTYKWGSTSQNNLTVITGGDPANYVWYNGNLWRASEINETENTIKLVMHNNISSFSYTNEPIGANWTSSIARKWLNTYYIDLLNQSKNSFIVPTKLCIDKDLNIDGTTCNSFIEDEILVPSVHDLRSSQGYRVNGTYWWTATPGSSYHYYVGSTGRTDVQDATALNGIRPMISIIGEALIKGGNGTIDAPYRIDGDPQLSSGDSITNISSGEYIQYDDKLWRVTEKNDQGIKMIYEDVSSMLDYINYGPSNEGVVGYNPDSGIGATTQLLVANKSQVVANAIWYYGPHVEGQPPTISIGEDGNSVRATVGIPVIGEMYATTKLDGQYAFWLMNLGRNSDYTWSISEDGIGEQTPPTQLRYNRPMIYLKSSAIIQSGSGLANDPYILK